jgi:hypothetical protein
VLDIKPDDIDGLEQIGDVVFLDYEPPGGGDAQELVVKREDFDALAKTGDVATILTNARGGARERPRSGRKSWIFKSRVPPSPTASVIQTGAPTRGVNDQFVENSGWCRDALPAGGSPARWCARS